MNEAPVFTRLRCLRIAGVIWQAVWDPCPGAHEPLGPAALDSLAHGGNVVQVWWNCKGWAPTISPVTRPRSSNLESEGQSDGGDGLA